MEPTAFVPRVQKPKQRKGFRVAVGLCAVLVVLAALGAAVFTLGFKRYLVPSVSMEPTLQQGDHVWVNQLAYRFDDVEAGDVVILDTPGDAPSDVGLIVKRVVALAGDRIEARPSGGVYVNGRRLDEPYLAPDTRTRSLPLQRVPDGQVFVLGDNRDQSQDSRVFGPVDEDAVVGRVML
ncbi:MAG TPA: signal peptidase I [Acidimicrobiales bacterium]|jgi:signal peptidase I